MCEAFQQSCGVGETIVANGIFSLDVRRSFLRTGSCSLLRRLTLLSLSSSQQGLGGGKLNGL